MPSPGAAPSPGDRFSRGVKENSTKGHKDSTRPFLPLQGRDEPPEIPHVSVLDVVGEGKGGKVLCLLHPQETQKEEAEQAGSREMPWLPTNIMASALGEEFWGDQLTDQEEPCLGEDFLQKRTALVSSSISQHPLSTDVPPAGDTDPCKSCGFQLHTLNHGVTERAGF